MSKASDESRRKHVCTRKIQHMSREIAEFYMRSYQRKFGKKSHKMCVYHCEYCGFFHVGHKMGTKPTRKKTVDDPPAS